MQGDDNQSADYSDDSSSLSSHESESDEYKEDEEEEDYLGFPLHEAAAKNDVEQLIKLISLAQSQGNPIDLNERYKFFSKTPLHVAAENNVGSSHYDVVEVLLKNGADINAGDLDNRTPLWYVVENCNLEMLNLFLRFKADYTHEDVGSSSLISAATKNFDNLDVLQFIVKDIGLDINHKDKFGVTPLHNAACAREKDRHFEVLKYLLENGADVNARCDGRTPLYYLVRFYGNWKVVELFLNHNADFNSSILFAFRSNDCDLQVMDKLINDFGLDVNHQNINNNTPLHNLFDDYWGPKPLFNLIKCLLKNGANLNAPYNDGVTPLIKAVRVLREHNVHWFLENLDYFNFLMEHTDFSVVHKSVHILDYEVHDSPKKVSNWILEHLAKLKFLNVPIHLIVIENINNRTEYKDYFEKCNKELEAMSNTKPLNSWINFFNLLVDSRRKLKNYTGNKSLIQDYKNNDWLQMFPIYGASMKKNVEKGLKRRKLFDESADLLSDCLPIFRPNHLIVEDILDCILSKKVLSKFCE